MAFQFSQARHFEPGMLFLGLDENNRPKGISTERHAITVAGAGSGKGAALIIPNLLRWLYSTVVIDPKGENAEQTWKARESIGQLVGIVDPFRAANVPDRLRVSINPLSAVDPDSLTARADIQAIADGLVVRHNPQHAQWDSGAAAILAGVIAYVIGTAPPEHRTLTAVRKVLLQPDGIPETKDDEPSGLYADALRMTAFEGCGGLTASVGRTIITALTSTKGMERDCLGGARDHSAWIDDPAHAAVLGSSTFDLAALKTGKASLYLVIPPEYLDTQGAFLRLFVRSALNAMAKGNRTGGKCLFLLDEFYSLGHLEIVAKAAGLMRSYGVQLWPFLQDLGQLKKLYGNEGAQTFFGNADAHIFFGNTDELTLGYVSNALGVITPHEVSTSIPTQRDADIHMTPEATARASEEARTRYGNERAYYEHLMRDVGKPRLTPSQVKRLVSKQDGDSVARSMIVFAKSDDVVNVKLWPYFLPAPEIIPDTTPVNQRPQKQERLWFWLTKQYVMLLLPMYFLMNVLNWIQPHSIPDEAAGALFFAAVGALFWGAYAGRIDMSDGKQAWKPTPGNRQDT